MPANIFYGTGIPTIVMVLKQKRENTDVLIVDASKGYVKEGKNNKLQASDIKKIVDAVNCRESVDKYSKVVSRDEIRANGYNLNIPRYVDSSEPGESWDIYASMFGGLPISEIDEFKEYWEVFPNLRSALFQNTSSEYCKLVVDDIKKAITEHAEVKAFEEKFQSAFEDLDEYLYDELILKMENLSIYRTEDLLSDNIFARLSDISLIDKYKAYQLLDDDWNQIAVDLEIIQTEGFDATKVVDPNMVVKKKGNDEQEVQEGWKGHVIPFDLIQSTLLVNEKAAITEKENILSEIASEYEEVLNSLSEEEKEQNFVNEDSFVFAEIKKALKSESIEPETKEKLKRVAELNSKEKSLKAELKTERALLEENTKSIIENLSDDQVVILLKEKWINPLIKCLMRLPENVVAELVAKLEALAKKYEITFEDVESQIEEAEKSLSAMLDELEGGEYDMLGLAEFKKILGGTTND